MKCPIFIIGDRRAQLGEETEIGDCIRQDCGVFNQLAGRCGVLEISLVLQAIGGVLGRIRLELTFPRITFRCHYCGITVQLSDDQEVAVPYMWDLVKQVDGHNAWICDRCQVQAES